jgi:hypothetical protein
MRALNIAWPVTIVLSLIVLGSAGLAPSSAVAQGVNGESRYHYATCSCHFGYGSACVPAVACLSEGGRCSASCTQSRHSE